jgi:hypothetical protein
VLSDEKHKHSKHARTFGLVELGVRALEDRSQVRAGTGSARSDLRSSGGRDITVALGPVGVPGNNTFTPSSTTGNKTICGVRILIRITYVCTYSRTFSTGQQRVGPQSTAHRTKIVTLVAG